MKVNKGKTDQKIKPIVIVRTDPNPKKIMNDTAFYFKTEKNYHFVAVNEKTLRLEVKSVPVSQKTEDSYMEYLSFGPEPQDSCPRIPEEQVDAPLHMKRAKRALSTSPMSDLGTDRADSDRSKKSSISSSCGSDAPSPCGGGKLKFDQGMASDSGVDDGPKDRQDDSQDNGPATLVAAN